MVVPPGGEDRGELPPAADAVRVQPVRQLVLALGLLHRGQVGGEGGRLHGLLLHVDELLEQLGVQLVVREHRELVPHALDPLAQPGGGAHRGGGRVVQLVRETRGQRAQREQLLTLVDDLLAAVQPLEQSFQQVDRHREPGADRGAEVLAREHEEPGIGDDPAALQVPLLHGRVQVGLHGTHVHTDLVGPHRLDVVRADLAGQRHRAGQQHDERLRRLSLGEHDAPGPQLGDPAVLDQPVELLVVERLEEEQPAHLVAGQRAGRVHDRHVGDPR